MSTYLYNGVALADIYTVYTPELQKSHPFAYIVSYEYGIHYLFVASQQATYYPHTPGSLVSARIEGFGNYTTFYNIPKNDETWHLDDDNYDGCVYLGSDNRLLWCNTPVYNVTDGTIYLAASEPVPVGSAPEVEPKAFTNGWDIGQFVRAML